MRARLSLLIAAPMMLALVLADAGTAPAASLRTMTTLHGPDVYLRDLFDDAGHNADARLGPGPEPGGRIIVEAAQLNAIARQFGVAWTSVSSSDRAVLEWPGRPLRREEAVEAARIAITAAGAPNDWDIELPGFSPPVVPFETDAVPTVSQLDYDRQSGRFTAILSVTAEGMHPINTRISGQVMEMADVPVAATRLLPETVLRADDVRMARVRASLLATDTPRAIGQVVGLELRRAVQPGQPLHGADLIRPPLVRRGAVVQMQLAVGGLSVSGQAVAVESGADGDRIRVQNMNSRALLMAQVIGPGLVRVTPDAPAIYPAGTGRMPTPIATPRLATQ
ncbi:flagellar basal body P-ring formation chaperone FlgA [Rhodopila sp.]|jgi:flagella basal body P-ring formation protein FlgA|uniref:flagellar basal body P-ring formation chaperone FlgA n=1 Tax=Rhodopila sp. TaxID=2480087 RepID=UPI002CABCA4C|nr:flagellar basal body P-ring formation chaperone FlgA [Rhodopila sp.]HVZ08421.1 flagellar basal body P-ring formation chaperone FlgA [Rhodopila sp.]